MDILIRNGMVVDPSDQTMKKMDIGVENCKIIRLENVSGNRKAAIEVDAADCIVTPGLIDCHIHLYAGSGESGMMPDISCLPYGVTGAVEGGSAGVSNYELFSSSIVRHSAVTVKSYLNVSPAGHAMIKYYPENVDPQYFDSERIADCVQRHSGEIVGIKVRISRHIVGELGLSPLYAAVKIGEKTGLPVVVHVTDPPEDVDRVLDALRPGDVFAHVYHGTGYSIIGGDGRVKPCVWEAQKRGVVFDSAHGIANFSNKVAKQAMGEGFFPDTISTDATTKSMYRQPVHSMPFMLSKYLSLGMPLTEVVRATALKPAQMFGFDGRGTLRDGACADIAVFRVKEKPMRFIDGKGDEMEGDRVLIPEMTVKDGVILYRQVEF